MNGMLLDTRAPVSRATPRRSRDLALPVLGQSDFLLYLETNTDWIERLAPEQAATRPHVLFLRIGMLHEVDDPVLAEAPGGPRAMLSEHRAQAGPDANFIVVFDYAHEGPGFQDGLANKFAALHDILRDYDIPGDRALFLHHNERLRERDDGYVVWCRRHGLVPMRMVYAHGWLLEQAQHLQKRYGRPEVYRAHEATLLAALAPETLRKTHKYLCYNYFPRLHRVLLLLHFMEQDLLKDGLASFPGFLIPEASTDFMADTLANMPNWRWGRRLAHLLPALQAMSPLRVDSGAHDGKGSLMDMFVETPFIASAFSVVTETGFSHGLTSRRITEKFLKPVVHLHPFLVLGEPGSLELMRDLGFQTFAPFFDERYDRVIEPEQRLELVAGIVREKCALSLPDLAAELRAMLPTLRANMHHAVHGLWERVRQESEYPVLNLLLDILAAPGPRIATPFSVEPRPVPPPVTPSGQPIPLPEALLQTLPLGASFAWDAIEARDGRACHALRADHSQGGHCLLLRVGWDLKREFAFSLDIRAGAAERFLIQLKDPATERFRGTFDFRLGVFIGHHSVDGISTIEASATYLGDGWFTLRFVGRVGEGDGPLDIVLYAGRAHFVYDGAGDTEFWFANMSLTRLPDAQPA